ncbi:MAG: hypothetical protein L0Y74_06620 [candidate division Zixibacteria bacterium]|nr:hypothetical protein [candidate division Zixibacteria bacterium]
MVAHYKIYYNLYMGIFDWISENKQWLFDGIGALFVLALMGWLWKKITDRRKPSVSKELTVLPVVQPPSQPLTAPMIQAPAVTPLSQEIGITAS